MTAEVTAALERVGPGDVLVVPGGKSGGRVAVLSTTRRRGGDLRLRAITPDRRVLSLGPRDFPAPPRPVAQVDLPAPYAPNNAGFQRHVASALMRRPPARRRPGRLGGRRPSAVTRRAGHGPGRGGRRPPGRRLPRRPPPPAGARAGRAPGPRRRPARAAHPGPHRVPGPPVRPGAARARGVGVRRRVVPDRRPGSAWPACTTRPICWSPSACSRACSTASTRRSWPAWCRPSPTRPRGPARRPAPVPSAARLRERWTGHRRAWPPSSTRPRTHAGLPLTRRPDPGFIDLAYGWAAGQDLEQLIADEEISGGDFVRNIKQLIDLLRQLGQVAPDPATARAARAASDRLFRGVVAASSVVSVGEDDPGGERPPLPPG